MKRNKKGQFVKQFNWEEAYNFNKNGVSLNKLARMYGVSYQSVQRALALYKKGLEDENKK